MWRRDESIAFRPCLDTLCALQFFSIYFISMIQSSKSFSFVKFYFTIVAVISVIGTVIAYAIASYQLLRTVLITDEEWIVQRGRYEIDACKQPTYVPSPVDSAGMVKPAGVDTTVAKPKTAEEIAQCETDTRARLIAQRAYETKDQAIGGIVWGSFFLVLFLTHYPRMIKLEKDRPTDTTPSSTPTKTSPARKRVATPKKK